MLESKFIKLWDVKEGKYYHKLDESYAIKIIKWGKTRLYYIAVGLGHYNFYSNTFLEENNYNADLVLYEISKLQGMIEIGE